MNCVVALTSMMLYIASERSLRIITKADGGYLPPYGENYDHVFTFLYFLPSLKGILQLKQEEYFLSGM